MTRAEPAENVQIQWPNEVLDPDTFGLAISTLVRDLHLIARKKGSRANRIGGLLTTFFLLFSCISIQIYLLSQVKHFVSAKSVHDIRRTYDDFENVMYDGHTYVYRDLPIVERRGIGGPFGPYFNVSAFNRYSRSEQDRVCHIPMSQPYFLGAVLLVWTIVCFADLRKALQLFEFLIIQVETCDSMAHAMREDVDSDDEASMEHGDETPMRGDDEGGYIIQRLTRQAKASIVLLVIIPRVAITTFLLWVGCRWLVATDSFSDIILNAVALEFVLSLKDTLYWALVPRRHKVDLERTRIQPISRQEPEKATLLLHTFVGIFVAVLWVVVYVGTPHTPGLQRVLAGYQWDVRDVCRDFLRERYAV